MPWPLRDCTINPCIPRCCPVLCFPWLAKASVFSSSIPRWLPLSSVDRGCLPGAQYCRSSPGCTLPSQVTFRPSYLKWPQLLLKSGTILFYFNQLALLYLDFVIFKIVIKVIKISLWTTFFFVLFPISNHLELFEFFFLLIVNFFTINYICIYIYFFSSINFIHIYLFPTLKDKALVH